MSYGMRGRQRSAQSRQHGHDQRVIDSLYKSLSDKNAALTFLLERFGDLPVDSEPDSPRARDVYVVKKATPAEVLANG